MTGIPGLRRCSTLKECPVGVDQGPVQRLGGGGVSIQPSG